MKALFLLPSALLTLAGWSVTLPLLAQTPAIPIDSVESPEVPTGSSNDIQGIERNYNNWNWDVENRYSSQQEESSYILAPESRSPDQLTDEFEWENIGEPSNSGGKIPVGNF